MHNECTSCRFPAIPERCLDGERGARLVAVTDVAAGVAQAFAAGHGCAAEPTLDAVLGRGDVDVVCVCVPSGLHAEVGVRAAKAGMHLVVEKPIDVSLDAADRLQHPDRILQPWAFDWL